MHLISVCIYTHTYHTDFLKPRVITKISAYHMSYIMIK